MVEQPYDGSMANCYRCGRHLPEVSLRRRRKVKTGFWVRTRYDTGKTASVNVHYGMRIVCPVCARQMDLESAKRLAMERLGVLAALAALMAALALLKSGLF